MHVGLYRNGDGIIHQTGTMEWITIPNFPCIRTAGEKQKIITIINIISAATIMLVISIMMIK